MRRLRSPKTTRKMAGWRLDPAPRQCVRIPFTSCAAVFGQTRKNFTKKEYEKNLHDILIHVEFECHHLPTSTLQFRLAATQLLSCWSWKYTFADINRMKKWSGMSKPGFKTVWSSSVTALRSMFIVGQSVFICSAITWNSTNGGHTVRITVSSHLLKYCYPLRSSCNRNVTYH